MGERLGKRPSSTPSTARWQERAWRYFDTLGEIHYAGDFFGANLSRVRLIVQRQDEKGEWVEVTDGEPADQLARLQGPRGDRAEIQNAYGTITFVVGEGVLFGTAAPEGEGEVWEFLSADEVKIEAREGRAKRKRRRNGREDEDEFTLTDDLGNIAPGEAIAVRMWNPHPRYSDEAESALMAVLDACEELTLLPRAVRSRARSRLASAGILVLPEEVTEPAAENPGMDEDPKQDPFLDELIDTAAAAINDEDSAAAAVPIIFRTAGEFADKVQHLTFVDGQTAYPETDREVHVIRRIAQGLNLPPEVLVGLADANHWSAWQISEAVWTQHLEPMCQQFCANLTSALLVPVTGPEFRVWYDDADLVVKPDRTGDAKELHDRLAISDAALREAAGWSDDDEPDEDERNRRIGVILKDAKLATTGEVSEPVAPVVQAGPPNGGTPPPPAGGTPGTTETVPPDPNAAATAAALAVGVARAREAAGAKVLTRLQRAGAEVVPPGTLRRLKDVDRSEVCAHVGKEALEVLGLDADGLVKGSTSCLTAAGYPAHLAARAESLAVATLFDRSVAPPLA